MTKVSVVIPAYNAALYLTDALESVCKQTLGDIEIIVVDDGSVDETASVAIRHGDDRIIVITKENGGAASARNAGINASKSPFIAFLDADDFWHEQKIDKQIKVMEKCDDIGICHTGIQYFENVSDARAGRYLSSSPNDQLWEKSILDSPIRCGSSPMVRKDCFVELGGFDESLKFAEDWDMWLRILDRYKMENIDEPLTYYRQHAGNMTKGYKVICENMIKVINNAFERRLSFEPSLKRRALGQAYIFSSWRALYANDITTSTKYLLKSLIVSRTNSLYRLNTVRLVLSMCKYWLARVGRRSLHYAAKFK